MVACRYGIIIKLTLFFSGQLQSHSGFTAPHANSGTLIYNGKIFLQPRSDINIIDM